MQIFAKAVLQVLQIHVIQRQSMLQIYKNE